MFNISRSTTKISTILLGADFCDTENAHCTISLIVKIKHVCYNTSVENIYNLCALQQGVRYAHRLKTKALPTTCRGRGHLTPRHNYHKGFQYACSEYHFLCNY